LNSFGSRPGSQKGIPREEIAGLLLLSAVVEVIQGRLLPPYLHSHLFLVVVLYVGWYSAPAKSAFCGTVFGIAEDYLVGIYLGMNGLSKTLFGFGATYFSRWMAAEAGPARAVLIAVMTALDRWLVLGLLFLLGQGWRSVPLVNILGSALLTGVVGEVFFRLYDKIRFPPKDFRRF
jgi:rod shape-determining protein MreD